MRWDKLKTINPLWKPNFSETRADDVSAIGSLRFNMSRVVLILCIAGVIVYFFGFFEAFTVGTNSAFTWIWFAWNKISGYTHAKASPVVLLLLLVVGWHRARGSVKKSDWRGLIIVIAGIILFLISVRMVQARLAILGFILIFFGGTVFMAGRRAAVAFLFPAFFMLLMVPIPLPPEIIEYWINLVRESLRLVANPLGVTIQAVGDDMFMALPGEPSFYFKSAMSPNGIIQSAPAVSALYCYFLRSSLPRLGIMVAAGPLFALVGLITKCIVGMILFKAGFSNFAANAYNEVWGDVLVLAPAAFVLMMVSYKALSIVESKIRNLKPSEAA